MVIEHFSLAGKMALVLGASNPLGRAAAVALAEAGADVAVATTTRSQREAVAANSCANEIWALDRKGFAQAIDAADERDVDTLVERAASEFGRLDILVNAQDLHFAKPALDISLGQWRRVIDANLTGVFLACRAAGREMLKRESGRIVNISSVLAERGMANGSAYCAAQAGVLNLTRSLAVEWGPRGIRLNAIAPGPIPTEGAFSRLMPVKSLEDLAKKRNPLGRFGTHEELANLAAFMVSDQSSYINGHQIVMDGGEWLKGASEFSGLGDILTEEQWQAMKPRKKSP